MNQLWPSENADIWLYTANLSDCALRVTRIPFTNIFDCGVFPNIFETSNRANSTIHFFALPTFPLVHHENPPTDHEGSTKVMASVLMFYVDRPPIFWLPPFSNVPKNILYGFFPYIKWIVFVCRLPGRHDTKTLSVPKKSI